MSAQSPCHPNSKSEPTAGATGLGAAAGAAVRPNRLPQPAAEVKAPGPEGSRTPDQTYRPNSELTAGTRGRGRKGRCQTQISCLNLPPKVRGPDDTRTARRSREHWRPPDKPAAPTQRQRRGLGRAARKGHGSTQTSRPNLPPGVGGRCCKCTTALVGPSAARPNLPSQLGQLGQGTGYRWPTQKTSHDDPLEVRGPCDLQGNQAS